MVRVATVNCSELLSGVVTASLTGGVPNLASLAEARFAPQCSHCAAESLTDFPQLVQNILCARLMRYSGPARLDHFVVNSAVILTVTNGLYQCLF